MAAAELGAGVVLLLDHEAALQRGRVPGADPAQPAVRPLELGLGDAEAEAAELGDQAAFAPAVRDRGALRICERAAQTTP